MVQCGHMCQQPAVTVLHPTRHQLTTAPDLCTRPQKLIYACPSGGRQAGPPGGLGGGRWEGCQGATEEGNLLVLETCPVEDVE